MTDTAIKARPTKAPPVKAVVIGASAGAVQALLVILPALPASFSLPIFVVVHVPSDRDHALVSLLQTRCRITVKEAEDKEPVVGGTVYFAPADYHLLVEADGGLALSADEPVNYSRPSIDVLFESAADVYGPDLLGVILTGANHDGSGGLKAVLDAGGAGIVQDPAEAYAATMPETALDTCSSATTMNLDAIALYLSSLGAA
jgi:two-component system chemotaxis response regulator CheB